ncbi:hypothetical protein HKX48_006782 [Thoreauomyces humboldtii]|nr:hypothetical protein HKX48_006782 [Thoreauomyces humboldtii]
MIQTADVGSPKIADLAAEARQDAKILPWWKKIRVPLMALAPLLMVLALGAVVIPICVVLLNTSHDVTNELSVIYFARVMKATKASVLQSVQAQKSAVQAFGNLPRTVIAMANQHNLMAETETFSLMAHVQQSYGLAAF